MRLLSIIFIWLALVGAPRLGQGAQAQPTGTSLQAAATEQTIEKEEHVLPTNAVELWKPNLPLIGDFPITNSMLVTWVVALGVIIFAQVATRNMKPVPEGAQNFWEWMVESLYNFLEGILGPKLVKETFWFFVTIFIFIVFTNWFGLIPGVGTVGWGHDGKPVFIVLIPVPFYLFEILIGLVQAFVFMLLTTVFMALICTHEEEHVKGQH